MTSGQSSVSVYNQSFDCGGNETSLSDCPTSPLDNCSDSTSVFVMCQGSGHAVVTVLFKIRGLNTSNVGWLRVLKLDSF